jgi:hypothetical protein
MVKKFLLGVTALGFLSFACSAFGQNTNMYFNGGTQGDVYCGGSEGCVYTGYYDGSINGVNVGPSQPGGPGMICDDYQDNISSGEQWTANGIQASTLNASNIGQTLFGAGVAGVSGIQIYTELAYLVNQMFTTTPTTAQLSAYSQALWYITGGVTLAQIGGTTGQAYQDYLAALSFFKNGGSLSQFANLWLYTPNPRGPNEAQEMWGLVAVPEGGAALMYLLLAGASCFGAILLRQRGLAHRT